MAVVQSEYVCASFLFYMKAIIRNSCITTTNRHCATAFDSATVSDCHPLAVGQTSQPMHLLPADLLDLLTDVRNLVRASSYTDGSSDHTSLLEVISMAHLFQILY